MRLDLRRAWGEEGKNAAAWGKEKMIRGASLKLPGGGELPLTPSNSHRERRTIRFP